jgi:hypothetical protein
VGSAWAQAVDEAEDDGAGVGVGVCVDGVDARKDLGKGSFGVIGEDAAIAGHADAAAVLLDERRRRSSATGSASSTLKRENEALTTIGGGL